MTKKQLLALKPGQLVSWHEPKTRDHNQRGKIALTPAGRLVIRWFDGEVSVSITENYLKRLAPHVRKERE